jgi:hypothetical protein
MQAPPRYNAAGQAIMHLLPMLGEGMGPPGTYFSFKKKDETEQNAHAIEVVVREKRNEGINEIDALVAKRLVLINRTFANSHRVFSVSFVDFNDMSAPIAFALHYEAPQVLDVAAMILKYIFLGMTKEEVVAQVPPFDMQAHIEQMQHRRAVEQPAAEEAPPIPPGEPG